MIQQLTARTKTALRESVLEPNPGYRLAIGILGVALPPVLVLGQGADSVQGSISAYYYTGGRKSRGPLWCGP